MRLHRIHLTNFRGVQNRSIEFNTNGITIVEGNNEAGKSSIFDALHMVLYERDSARSHRVKDAQPVNRDVGPEVAVHLSVGEYQFEYWKRWLKNIGTTLEISAPVPENHTGRAAHERVEQILAETLDADLWDALRMLQSGDLKMPAFTAESFGKALDISTDKVALDDSLSSLRDRVEKHYLAFWTKTGRVPKERASKKTEAKRAREARDDLQYRMNSVDADQAKLVKLTDTLGHLNDQEREQAVKLEHLTEQWDSTESLRRDVDRFALETGKAKAELEHARAEQQDRKRLIEEVKTAESRAKKSQTDLSTAKENLKVAVEQVTKAEEALTCAISVLEHLTQHLQTAEQDREHYAQLKRLGELRGNHNRVKEAQQQQVEAKKTIDVCLSRNDADRIADAEGAKNAAEASFTQSTAKVMATALCTIAVEINGEMVSLEQGDIKERHVVDVWELVLPEQLRVTVQIGDDSKHFADKFQAAQKQYETLCLEASVADTIEARQQATAREEAEKLYQEAENVITACLDGTIIDALVAEIIKQSEVTDSYKSARTTDCPFPADAEEAERAFDETVQQHETQKADMDDLKQALNDAQRDFATAETKVEQANKSQVETEKGLVIAETALADARKVTDDDAVKNNLDTKSQQLNDLRASEDNVRSQLESKNVEALKQSLENAQDDHERTKENIQANEQEQRRLEGALQQAGADGISTLLDQAESKLQAIERTVRSEDLKADAAKLLYKTFEKHRQSAHERCVEPFKQEVEKLGHLVFGNDFMVTLDEDMRVVSRTLNQETLSLDQLSTGTREQIGVLCRLACASITSIDGKGAPVVIDDALGWSDSDRLQTMGQAITQAGKRCQVVILTCMASRYGNVGEARTVRL
ncbi:MAG: AAA family ATPase [Acidimicrobiia bacterium]|nr:AAA family ATPase [Acidimicrobiia bacterium]MYC58525.1 AAA family ATPase [Acidimicrobiia bacterium]MYI30369.1 AAA family ATPase [Acidimicrobiia bacterium]